MPSPKFSSALLQLLSIFRVVYKLNFASGIICQSVSPFKMCPNRRVSLQPDGTFRIDAYKRGREFHYLTLLNLICRRLITSQFSGEIYVFAVAIQFRAPVSVVVFFDD